MAVFQVLSTAQSIVKTAFQIGGISAVRILADYMQLVYLNRTSRGLPIRRVPNRVPEATAAEAQAASGADIVVPVYNDFDGVGGLLRTLRQEAPQFSRIILAHDCSTDPRLAPLLQSFVAAVPNATLIENARNLGFLQTCNRGLDASDQDVIVLNTDIELPPGALGRLIAVLRRDPTIATATPFSSSAYGLGFPDLNYPNIRPFGASTAQVDAAFQAVGPLAPIDIPRGVGFCMAMSRRAIEAVGIFDPAFGRGYGEEADFCLRARKDGFRNVAAPNIYVYHREGQSFGTSSQALARAGLIRLLERHPDHVAEVRAYLHDSAARAICFAALVALLRAQSSRAVRFAECATPGTEDPVWIDLGRNSGRLQYRAESYPFVFADAAVAACAFGLARLAA